MMTTLATLSPPLKRLFDRIDATPVDSALGAALELWLVRRDGLLFPALADSDFAAREGGTAGLFACRRASWQAVQELSPAVSELG
ncbi:hypothetical protein [Labrys monachus]|uniref:Uncharacterized protein n=1 Tax=Labrys monachus TaxID=217067 RepID=A0ABU0F6P8_9HYPH|nr:hypothetical protein [Labrys monachus]MDQ0390292.1 hypothetical protein [Labrys monachus]